MPPVATARRRSSSDRLVLQCRPSPGSGWASHRFHVARRPARKRQGGLTPGPRLPASALASAARTAAFNRDRCRDSRTVQRLNRAERGRRRTRFGPGVRDPAKIAGIAARRRVRVPSSNHGFPCAGPGRAVAPPTAPSRPRLPRSLTSTQSAGTSQSQAPRSRDQRHVVFAPQTVSVPLRRPESRSAGRNRVIATPGSEVMKSVPRQSPCFAGSSIATLLILVAVLAVAGSALTEEVNELPLRFAIAPDNSGARA